MSSGDARRRTQFFNHEDWQERLSTVIDTVREMSRQTDPQAMVQAYGQRMLEMFPNMRRVSLSRRGLEYPFYKVTRYSEWNEDINPWKQPEKLPIYSGGLFADLIYSNEPRVIDQLEVDAQDPAKAYLEGQNSLTAVPLFDKGESTNMVLLTHTNPGYFPPEDLPERVWMANLFGRATQNLVLADELNSAYRQVDRELKAVADIQRSLLPSVLPEIPGLDIATYYQTSRRAGGDYYDFFHMPGDKWGILIADVSGHGTPAAVVMAVLHCIAHMYPRQPGSPNELLEFLNFHLTSRYTPESGHFVTAFYAIYDPALRTLSYASAGHNPPLLKRCGQKKVESLGEVNGFPLGLMKEASYRSRTIQLDAGDRLILYTDGITEAANDSSELFGTGRLEPIIADCNSNAQGTLDRVLSELDAFTGGVAANDDRTLLVIDVNG